VASDPYDQHELNPVFIAGTLGPITESLLRLVNRVYGPTRVSQSRSVWAATQLGMPARHRSRIELDLLGAQILVVMLVGLVAAAARVFVQGPNWRLIVGGVIFLITAGAAGGVWHYFKYLRALRLERRGFQQWSQNRTTPIAEAPLSSDRDFLLQLAIALPVTIWFMLNVTVSG
jgi:hypothetical protein